MNHTIKILSDQLKFYRQQLHEMEEVKKHHLEQMRVANSHQIKIQEVIDDLYKTIDRLEKDENITG